MTALLPQFGIALLAGAAVLLLVCLHRNFGPDGFTRLLGGFIALSFMAVTVSPGGINVLNAGGAVFVLLAMAAALGSRHRE